MYRGRLSRDPQRLENIVNVVMCITAIQVARSPLRLHVEMLSADDEDMLIGLERDRVAAERKRLVRHREHRDGLPLGNAALDLKLEGGRVVGPGAEPDPDALGIDTGRLAADFRKGDRALAWFWGLWWPVLIRYVSLPRNQLTVRWEWSRNETKAYRANLVHRLL